MSDPKELFRMDEEAREKIRKRIDRNYFVEAGAGWVVVEQDESYGRNPLDDVTFSRKYLQLMGW